MKKPAYTDKELITLIGQDNKEAFQIFFHLHYNLLARSLARYSREPEQIEDWIQEIFLKIWVKRKTLFLPEIKNLPAYLLIIARNYVLKEISKKKVILYTTHPDVTALEIADNHLEEKMNHSELSTAYAAALAALPPRTRNAYFLNREQGLTYSKVAEKMGISVKTVEAQIASALASLRRQLISFF